MLESSNKCVLTLATPLVSVRLLFLITFHDHDCLRLCAVRGLDCLGSVLVKRVTTRTDAVCVRRSGRRAAYAIRQYSRKDANRILGILAST